MKMLVVGDTHGFTSDVKQVIDAAKYIGGIDRLLIVGDFGLWWGHKGVQFIDDINEYARKNNMFIFALPGNHENMVWWNSAVKVAQDAKATSHGFAYLRTNVLLSPRTHRWSWYGKEFAIAGGAVSIDRVQRIRAQALGKGQSWSPDEQLTDEEVTNLLSWSAGKRTDYLFTHDCSNKTPFYGRFKADMESEMNRHRVDKVLTGLLPKMHFHGHMHTKYDWSNFVGVDDNGDAVYTETYGLQMTDDPDCFGVLDFKTDEFKWASELGFRANKRGQLIVPKAKDTE